MQKNQQKNNIKKAFWFDATLTLHGRKKLKDGTQKEYYIVTIPTWAVDRGEIDPIKKYRTEMYPIEEKKEKEE